MRSEEERQKISPTYIQDVQKELKSNTRANLVEWLVDVHRGFHLAPETLYLCVFILDKYLSKVSIRKNKLHIVCVACLIIANKYEEVYAPKLKEILKICGEKFTHANVVKREYDILNTLQFDVTTPSAYRFLERFWYMTFGKEANRQIFFFA